jgi:hypothetical protein
MPSVLFMQRVCPPHLRLLSDRHPVRLRVLSGVHPNPLSPEDVVHPTPSSSEDLRRLAVLPTGTKPPWRIFRDDTFSRSTPWRTTVVNRDSTPSAVLLYHREMHFGNGGSFWQTVCQNVHLFKFSFCCEPLRFRTRQCVYLRNSLEPHVSTRGRYVSRLGPRDHCDIFTRLAG